MSLLLHSKNRLDGSDSLVTSTVTKRGSFEAHDETERDSELRGQKCVDVTKLSLPSRLANRDVCYIFRRRSRPRDSARKKRIRKQNFWIRKQSFWIRKQSFWIRKQNFWIRKQNFWICKQNLLSNLFFDCNNKDTNLPP